MWYPLYSFCVIRCTVHSYNLILINWSYVHVLIIISVAVQCCSVSAQNVFNFSIRQSSALWSTNRQNSHWARVDPVRDRLAVCAEPVQDAVLVKVLHVSEGELIASSEKTNKVVATSLVIVPLFGNLQKTAKWNERMSQATDQSPCLHVGLSVQGYGYRTDFVFSIWEFIIFSNSCTVFFSSRLKLMARQSQCK